MPLLFNPSVSNLSVRMPDLKVDRMSSNEGRTFGPYFGLFLVNLLTKMVAAKYASYLPYQLAYDADPWLAYNKPVASYNHRTYYSQWHPIKNPYYDHNYYHNYPTLTTAAPYVRPSDYINDYQEYDYSATIEPQHLENLISAESNSVQKFVRHTTPPLNKSLVAPTFAETQIHAKSTTASSTSTSTASTERLEASTSTISTTAITPSQEPVVAESSVKVKRHPTQRYKKRVPSRNRQSQRRRKTTTPSPEYYDSYEEYTERFKPNRRRRPPHNRQSAETYYDYDEYYDSLEATTRYYKKKQKRRTTRRPIKNQSQDESIESESTTLRFNPNTEIVIVRQAQTTPPTTAAPTTTSGTTTTEPTTIITNTTTVAPASTTPNATYGYGPSNGNEQVSFTYGPPVGNYQYQVPYFDWYAHEATKNAVVKRVHDIVNTDERLQF